MWLQKKGSNSEIHHFVFLLSHLIRWCSFHFVDRSNIGEFRSHNLSVKIYTLLTA